MKGCGIQCRMFSRSIIKMNEEEKKPLSYSEQITKRFVEHFRNILEKEDDPSRFDKLRSQIDSEENQVNIQSIIRDVRNNMTVEPSEETIKAQEDKMDDKRKQQMEIRKQLEIERRKNAGQEPKKKAGGIEYKVVERG